MENIDGMYIVQVLFAIFIVVPAIIFVIRVVISAFYMLYYHHLIEKKMHDTLPATEILLITAIQHKSLTDLTPEAIAVTNKRVTFYKRNSIFGKENLRDMHLTPEMNVHYEETSSLIMRLIGLGKANLTVQTQYRTEKIDHLFTKDAAEVKQRIYDNI